MVTESSINAQRYSGGPAHRDVAALEAAPSVDAIANKQGGEVWRILDTWLSRTQPQRGHDERRDVSAERDHNADHCRLAQSVQDELRGPVACGECHVHAHHHIPIAELSDLRLGLDSLRTRCESLPVREADARVRRNGTGMPVIISKAFRIITMGVPSHKKSQVFRFFLL